MKQNTVLHIKNGSSLFTLYLEGEYPVNTYPKLLSKSLSSNQSQFIHGAGGQPTLPLAEEFLQCPFNWPGTITITVAVMRCPCWYNDSRDGAL